jgi:hypothetical protein
VLVALYVAAGLALVPLVRSWRRTGEQAAAPAAPLAEASP